MLTHDSWNTRCIWAPLRSKLIQKPSKSPWAIYVAKADQGGWWEIGSPYPSQVVVHNVAKPGMVRGHGLQPYTALFVFVFMAVTLHFSFFKGFYYYLFIFALTHSLTQCRYYKIVHGCNVSQCQPKFNPRVHPLTLWQSQLGKLSVLRDSSLLLLQKS